MNQPTVEQPLRVVGPSASTGPKGDDMRSPSLSGLPDAIEQEPLVLRQEAVATILGRLAHDLSSPISTLRLESQNLDLVTGEAKEALGAGRTEAVTEALVEVQEIGENLALAAQRLRALADLARELSEALRGGDVRPAAPEPESG